MDVCTAAKALGADMIDTTNAVLFKRAMARALDNLIVFAAIDLSAPQALISALSPTTMAVFTLLLALLSESIFIWAFGATPGKALFGFRVRSKGTQSLSLGTSCKRSFLVWTLGQGCGFWLFYFVALAVAARRLTETGEAAWDQHCGTRVHAEP